MVPHIGADVRSLRDGKIPISVYFRPLWRNISLRQMTGVRSQYGGNEHVSRERSSRRIRAILFSMKPHGQRGRPLAEVWSHAATVTTMHPISGRDTSHRAGQVNGTFHNAKMANPERVMGINNR